MPTNITRPSRPVPMAPEGLDLNRRSLALYRDIVSPAEIRTSLDKLGLRSKREEMTRTAGRRAMQLAAEELLDLRNAGVEHAHALAMHAWLGEVVEDLYCEHTIDLHQLEVAEVTADLAEERAQLNALLEHADDNHAMLERARLLRTDAARSLALARGLEMTVRHNALGINRRTA